jgi:hypothetical protein
MRAVILGCVIVLCSVGAAQADAVADCNGCVPESTSKRPRAWHQLRPERTDCSPPPRATASIASTGSAVHKHGYLAVG